MDLNEISEKRDHLFLLLRHLFDLNHGKMETLKTTSEYVFQKQLTKTFIKYWDTSFGKINFRTIIERVLELSDVNFSLQYVDLACMIVFFESSMRSELSLWEKLKKEEKEKLQCETKNLKNKLNSKKSSSKI